MSEQQAPIVQIEPANWEEFLREFSERNNNRRARFEIFSGGRVQEEDQEARLEEVSVEREGKSATVKILRIDRAEKNADKIKNEITNVRGISAQYDTDGSENALEITDGENNLVSLKMESKVDGAS